MSENSADNPHQQWSRFWESASGFWRGPPAWRVWLLCAALIAIVVLQLYVQFRFDHGIEISSTRWRAATPTACGPRRCCSCPCAARALRSPSPLSGRMTVQRKWREWLTTHLIDYWSADDRYARLAQIQGEPTISRLHRGGCEDRNGRADRFCAWTCLIPLDRYHLHSSIVECRRRRCLFLV